MTSSFIEIRDKWDLLFCYALRRMDEYEIRAMLMSLGMRGAKIDEATDVLLFEKNTGFCISNERLRMSVIFIGEATSEEQFWDTVVHELGHCANHICEYYGVPLNGEDYSWTLGYLMRMVVSKVAPPCVD